MIQIVCDCCHKTVTVDCLYKGYVEITVFPGAMGNDVYIRKEICADCLKNEMEWINAGKKPVCMTDEDPWAVADDTSGN